MPVRGPARGEAEASTSLQTSWPGSGEALSPGVSSPAFSLPWPNAVHLKTSSCLRLENLQKLRADRRHVRRGVSRRACPPGRVG